VFEKEIVPVEVPQKKAQPVRVSKDEYPRLGTTAAALAGLKSAFTKEGTVTAGNASGINDGAAALVVSTESWATKNGRKPLARILSYCTTGVDPMIMGMGPVEAMRRAVDRAGLTLGEIGDTERNESLDARPSRRYRAERGLCRAVARGRARVAARPRQGQRPRRRDCARASDWRQW